MPIQQNIEDAVVRNITLVQTGLQVLRGTSQSISGSVARTATPAEKWMQVNHWALDIGDGYRITRFELERMKDGTSTCLVTRNIKITGEYSPHYIGSKGKTMLNDAIIEERANIIINQNPHYTLFSNNCQTFALLLFDEIAFEKSPWVAVNSWTSRLTRSLGF